jgi:hypothetical protein
LLFALAGLSMSLQFWNHPCCSFLLLYFYRVGGAGGMHAAIQIILYYRLFQFPFESENHDIHLFILQQLNVKAHKVVFWIILQRFQLRISSFQIPLHYKVLFHWTRAFSALS